MAGRKIQYIKQETPSFIKNFKVKVGYKEPDTVEKKFEKQERSSHEDEEDREGEKPVVILGSNVTEKEANDFLDKKRKEELVEEKQSDKDITTHEREKDNGDQEQQEKIMFRKPVKRKSDNPGKDNRKKQKEKQKSSKSSNSSKAVKNPCLLSFGDDEEEEG